MDDAVRIHIHLPGEEKTEELVCNWCGLPHKVEPNYKKEVLERGKKLLEEYHLTDQVKPEETWTCGACYLYVNKLPPIKTECNHVVPKERA